MRITVQYIVWRDVTHCDTIHTAAAMRPPMMRMVEILAAGIAPEPTKGACRVSDEVLYSPVIKPYPPPASLTLGSSLMFISTEY